MWTLTLSTCSIQIKWEAKMFRVLRIKTLITGEVKLTKHHPRAIWHGKAIRTWSCTFTPMKNWKIILLYDRISRLYLMGCSSPTLKSKSSMYLGKKVPKVAFPPRGPALSSCWASTLTASRAFSDPQWRYRLVKYYSRACAWWHPANNCPTRYVCISRECHITELFIWLLEHINYLKYFQKRRAALHKLSSRKVLDIDTSLVATHRNRITLYAAHSFLPITNRSVNDGNPSQF